MLSNARPKHCSNLDANLFHTVACPNSRGTPDPHPLNSNPHNVSLLPHDLCYGDIIPMTKDDNIFRIGYCNIGSFTASTAPNKKAQEIKHFMASHDLNLFGGCEANLN